jgi:hypothetical protein
MERVEAAHCYEIPVERGFTFITDTADAVHERHFEPDDSGFVYRLVVEYEPRAGIVRLFDRLLLARGIRRAFQSTFAALERELVR